ncbi:Nuclease-related domain, NERD [Trema orientale]|uniref:Nuclease-related domain, NERD n=1 Tax=Trema orientale TaxID=63057 RepID=A0A2P5BL30_TREOI|nr:Nuclease-related domain, NERD [Trema orientale]
MWAEILFGLIMYRLVRRFLYDDDILEVETSDSNALFSVADRLEKLYGGKAYVGLRIPDADTATRQNIDLVLLTTKGEAVVVSVKNLAGFVLINADGTWVCETKNKTQTLPDPVEETRKQASILESYLEQRGILLPHGYLSCKVILPNPKCCTIQSSSFPSEVITYDQWVQLKPEAKGLFSGWIKGAFRGGKKETQESIQQNLSFILSTAPVWDRLELRGNKYVLGEFLEFKGKQEDLQALRNIKRSKVSRLIIQKTSMLGLAHSRLQVLYTPRDYRNEGASASEWKELGVRSSTEVLFQPQNSTKVRKFKFSSIVSMSLSA